MEACINLLFLAGKTKSPMVRFFFSIGGLHSQLTGLNGSNRECVSESLGAVRVVIIKQLFTEIDATISEKTFGTGKGNQLASAAFEQKASRE